MRLLLVPVLLLATPAIAATPPAGPASPPTRACPPAFVQPVDRTGAPPRVRRMTDLPPANLELAVNRRINGCPVPTIVRYRVDERPTLPSRQR